MVRVFKEFEQDGWWYRIAKSPNGGGYIILAKKDRFVLPEFEPILEPGELWFEFGKTEDEALDNMRVTHYKFNLTGNE